MAHISVITKRDLDAIRDKVESESIEISDGCLSRKHLQEMSQARAAKWPNTLQATRERKQREKQQRMAVEEARRIEVDNQESELKEKRRWEQIERTNRMLFDATDKAKAFHGKLLMSDVLKEREAQIEYKKHLSELQRMQDEQFHNAKMKAVEAAEDAELCKMAEQSRLAMKQQEDRTKQLDSLRARLLAEREANVKEGERIWMMAKEEEEETRLKAIRDKERVRQAYEETMEANRALHVFKLKEIEREKQADQAVIEYSQRRESMMEERLRREMEKTAMKEDMKARMMNYMEKNYKEAQEKAEAQVRRNIEASEEKKEKEEKSAHALKMAEIESTHKSRQQQISLKKEKQQKLRQEEQEAVKAWKARTKELEEEERRMRDKAWENGQMNKRYLEHQIKQKEIRRAQQAVDDLEVVAMLQMSLEDESSRFKDYAAECTKEWTKGCKSTKPMDLYLTAKQKVDSI